jgi:hypothetical protein
LQYDGKDGMVGYLMWLGLYHPATFGAILRGTMPLNVNARTEQQVKVEYKSFEKVLVELRASGLTDEKTRPREIDCQSLNDIATPRMSLALALTRRAPRTARGRA